MAFKHSPDLLIENLVILKTEFIKFKIIMIFCDEIEIPHSWNFMESLSGEETCGMAVEG